MGGTITQPSDRQVISDLRIDRDTLENLLKDIIRAKNDKLRKLAIDKARDVVFPPISNENTDAFWKHSLNFGWYRAK